MASIKPIFEKYGIYIFLGLLFIFSSLISPAFLTVQNIKNILTPAAALGIVSIGQTMVILTGGGGLDLSVASIMAGVAVIIAHHTAGQDAMLLPVGLLCLVFGMLIGLVNGLLITKRKVQPFIATLGVMTIVQGLRFVYTGGAPKGSFPPILRFLGTGSIGPIPASVLSLALLMAIAAIVLKKTVFGRQLYAIGGNINTARLSGYNTSLVITMVYVISGFSAALAGLYLAGWVGIADNWVGKGYEIDSIAAVVMGGTSFAGGRGGIFGTIAGVLILVILYNMVLLLHFPIHFQYLVKGAAIILAVSFYVRRSAG